MKVLMIMMLLAASMLGIASAEDDQNPIVVCNDQGEKMDAADPFVMRFNGKYYLYTTGPSDTPMPVPNQPDVKGDARGDLRNFTETEEGYFAEVSVSSRFTQECNFILNGGEMAWRMGSREGKPALITTDGEKIHFTVDDKEESP